TRHSPLATQLKWHASCVSCSSFAVRSLMHLAAVVRVEAHVEHVELEHVELTKQRVGTNQMDISLEMNAEQSLRVSPTLIAVNQILALSSLELQAAIKQEAEENPALEIQERQTCNI